MQLNYIHRTACQKNQGHYIPSLLYQTSLYSFNTGFITSNIFVLWDTVNEWAIPSGQDRPILSLPTLAAMQERTAWFGLSWPHTASLIFLIIARLTTFSVQGTPL